MPPGTHTPAAHDGPVTSASGSAGIAWMRLCVICGPFLGWAIVRNGSPWGDEAHFLWTVRLFGEGLSLQLLRSYPEMSGPLTYLLYAAWGSIAGFDTPALRLLSPAIAAATMLTWHAVLTDILRSRVLSLIALATIILNPYVLGLSVFVFTDMLALLGLALSSLGVCRRSAWLSGAGLAIATCSRQYLAFLAIALVGLALLRPREPERSRWLVAGLAGMIPLALLVLLWNGHLAPDNDIRDVYTSAGVRFDPHALSLYLSAPAVYLVPLVALAAPRLRHSPLPLVVAGLAALVVLLFPVEPSIAQTREGVSTVGFLHRLIVVLFEGLADRFVFALLAFANVWLLVSALPLRSSPRGEQRLPDAEVFVWLAIAGFLMLMPFSYLPWEKYALPLLMLQSVPLALLISERPAPETHGVHAH